MISKANLAAIVIASFIAQLPQSVHAEIVDFNPATDPVPALLPPTDMQLINDLMSADFPYMVSRPNPAGTKVLIHKNSGFAILDIDSGNLIDVDGAVGGEIAYHGWVTNDELGLLLEPPGLSSTQAVTLGLATQTINVMTGKVSSPSKLEVPSRVAGVLGVSPDFKSLIVVDFEGSTAPAARTVTLGKMPWIKPDGLPDNLPGRVGQSLFGPMALFDARISVRLVDMSFRRWRTLAVLPPDSGVNPHSVNWSPDGSRFAITTMTLPGWAGDRVQGGPPQPGPVLDENSINVREAMGRLAWEENPLVRNTQVRVFSSAGDELGAVENQGKYAWGVLGGVIFGPPGTSMLVAIGYASEPEGRKFSVYSYPRDTYYALLDYDFNEKTQIVGSECSLYDFLADGSLHYASNCYLHAQFSTFKDGEYFKSYFNTNDSLFQVVIVRDRVLFSRQNVSRPLDFWIGETRTQPFEPARITRLSLRAENSVTVLWRPIEWEALDGWKIRGLYVYPESATFPPRSPAPLVVWQDGGPDAPILNAFGVTAERPVSILASVGLPVLLANGAGRRSMSQQNFTNLADSENFGDADVGQIRDGVEALVERKIVDTRAIGISGCSYGGYFALQSVSKYPEFYRAANAQCSLLDLFDEFEHGGTIPLAYLEGRRPMDDALEFELDSPIRNTRRISTPLLLFHGTKDEKPIAIVEAFHNDLTSIGTRVRLMRFIDEASGLADHRSQEAAVQELVEFFRSELRVPPRQEGGLIFLPYSTN